MKLPLRLSRQRLINDVRIDFHLFLIFGVIAIFLTLR